MNSLTVTNGYVGDLPGLGRIRKLESLSEKRITKAVRAKLRLEYGDENVCVACKAILCEKGWRGRCTIDAEEFGYIVSSKTIHIR